MLAYDHVLGADPEVHAPWNGPYDVNTTFHEPFVLFGYLAACTRLELVTGVIILPQRQTALVAKQAAEVDLLAEGRFRLGVGLGWNAVEYEALGAGVQRPRARGWRSRSSCCAGCWSEPVVTHDGRFDRITGAGLAPLPSSGRSRSGSAASRHPAYRRVGRLADGWFPQVPPGPKLDEAACDRRRGCGRGRPRPGDDRHGGPGRLDRRRRRQARRPRRSVARRRRDARRRSTR